MNITDDKLIQDYKKAKNIRKKERLHAICMIKINEYTITGMAKAIFCSYQYAIGYTDLKSMDRKVWRIFLVLAVHH